MKTYRIWNRSYRARDFEAINPQDAIDRAIEAGHLKKRLYRKLREVVPAEEAQQQEEMTT